MTPNPITAVGFAIILVLVFVAVFAPLLAPYGAYELNPSAVLAAAVAARTSSAPATSARTSSRRVLFGARYDLLIGFCAVAIGLVLGCTVGAVAGFVGGALDEVGHADHGHALGLPGLHPRDGHRRRARARACGT